MWRDSLNNTDITVLPYRPVMEDSPVHQILHSSAITNWNQCTHNRCYSIHPPQGLHLPVLLFIRQMIVPLGQLINALHSLKNSATASVQTLHKDFTPEHSSFLKEVSWPHGWMIHWSDVRGCSTRWSKILLVKLHSLQKILIHIQPCKHHALKIHTSSSFIYISQVINCMKPEYDVESHISTHKFYRINLIKGVSNPHWLSCLHSPLWVWGTLVCQRSGWVSWMSWSAGYCLYQDLKNLLLFLRHGGRVTFQEIASFTTSMVSSLASWAETPSSF